MEEKYSIRNFLIKAVVAVVFIVLLIYLLPISKLGGNNSNNNNNSNTNNYSQELNSLTAQIFAANINIMKEAAMKYYTIERLPQNVGDKKKLTLQEMLNMKLVLPLIDKEGKTCDANASYVEIEKKDTEYQFKINLKCGSQEDYIIVPVGCYDYCPTKGGVCQKEIEINGKKIKIVKAPVNSELLLTASSGTTFLTGYVNEKTLSEVMRNDKDLFGFRIFYQSDLKGDKKIEDITKKQYQLNFEKKYDFAKLQMFTEGVLTPAGVIGMIKGMITIFQLLLYGFLILVILMSVVNIFTTITINILLRSRELAILKSVGMSDKQFDKMLRGENYIACLRSIIFGIVVSLILLFLTKFVIDKGKVNIDFKFIMDMLGSINYIALIISIIIVYVITFISTLFAKKSIRSQDIVEVIRRDNI